MSCIVVPLTPQKTASSYSFFTGKKSVPIVCFRSGTLRGNVLGGHLLVGVLWHIECAHQES